MGLRAEESRARAKLDHLKVNQMLSKAGRFIYDWLPIHDWSTADVFETIADAGQVPHWAYADGNERLSCMFCIMGSPRDIKHAARINPELAAKYARLEERTGYTFFHTKSLADVIASDA
jgi:3'-phosphoadenosine 5'-phosphosulfate sulfotransferase (PAPS reductase)/FAD synthetase